MVCVKETATLPRDMLVNRLPKVWTAARGSTASSCREGEGGLGGLGGAGGGREGSGLRYLFRSEVGSFF